MLVPTYKLYFLGPKNSSKELNCTCGPLDAYDNPYSYCKTWFETLPPLCFLKGGSSVRDCPGAKKLKGPEIYLTSDEAICNASKCKKSLHIMQTVKLKNSTHFTIRE